MMARAIMIQGTMSNAGKSLLVGGLCRIFRQDGYRTAPFKSQNMALNSFITSDGLEMGRAQVMQAEAAGIEPDVRMNPILLKPTDDVGSQVIVNGEVLGNMPASEYFAYKRKLIPEIMKAYDSLAAEYDIVVLEGAGSPAEINLNHEDIVNMGMARMAKAPVLLAGDIDRGGVFAQLLGTQLLLKEWEKAHLKGMLINKFRGDERLLEPGIRMLEERSGCPVVGVVPFMELDIDDEDSLSERLSGGPSSPAAPLDAAVIRLPRLSNFTDFNALSAMPDFSLRYVSSPGRLGNPDIIFIPGTKNTMGDLKWLRESGMEAAVLRSRKRGSVIFGICGGFQMLGEELRDPCGVEGGGEMRGMGLLPLRTVFSGKKTRTRVSGKILASPRAAGRMSGLPVEGYEIHMGRSELTEENSGGESLCRLRDGVSGEEKTDGFVSEGVFGTYVHGFLDREEILNALADELAGRKGLSRAAYERGSLREYKERQYDLLAEGLRAHLDMDLIYRILERGV